jgi:hypothetical protein
LKPRNEPGAEPLPIVTSNSSLSTKLVPEGVQVSLIPLTEKLEVNVPIEATRFPSAKSDILTELPEPKPELKEPESKPEDDCCTPAVD